MSDFPIVENGNYGGREFGKLIIVSDIARIRDMELFF